MTLINVDRLASSSEGDMTTTALAKYAGSSKAAAQVYKHTDQSEEWFRAHLRPARDPSSLTELAFRWHSGSQQFADIAVRLRAIQRPKHCLQFLKPFSRADGRIKQG